MKAEELMKYKNWVVVGGVTDKNKYAYRILSELKETGYNVKGVNPKGDSLDTYKKLKEVDYKIDVLDLCINPMEGIKIVKEAHEQGINNILIQPGAESNEILDYCKDKGINAVEGCALVQLSNLK